MNKHSFSIDASEVEKMLSSIKGERIKLALISTLRKASNKVTREVTEEFKHLKNQYSKGRKGALIAYTKSGGKSLKPVFSRVFKKSTNPFATVTIRANGRTDFRALFFELGTKERRTKKGKRRGRIQAGYYFKTATSRVERQVMSELESDALKALRTQLKRQSK